MNLTKIFHPLPMAFRRDKLVRLFLWLSPDSRIQLVEFNGGATLYADLSDAFPRSNFLTRSFEPEFFAIAGPFLKSGGVFFDVGANVGFCTFGLLHQSPHADLECHLFEANPEVCALIRQSAACYPGRNVHIQHGCVADARGVSKFKIIRDHFGASHVSPEGDVEVPHIVLADYAEEHRIARIDFMKIDVEGFEPRALQGADRLFEEQAVQALYLEISAETLARQGTTPEDCFHFLTERHYRIFYVKAVDLKRPELHSTIRTLSIKGVGLNVAPLSAFPKGHQTDVLALPENSPFLRGGS
jgi:FkbM family methyltransferase